MNIEDLRDDLRSLAIQVWQTVIAHGLSIGIASLSVMLCVVLVKDAFGPQVIIPWLLATVAVLGIGVQPLRLPGMLHRIERARFRYHFEVTGNEQLKEVEQFCKKNRIPSRIVDFENRVEVTTTGFVECPISYTFGFTRASQWMLVKLRF